MICVHLSKTLNSIYQHLGIMPPVFLPKESRGQRSLVGYSPWGCRVRCDLTEDTLQQQEWYWISDTSFILSWSLPPPSSPKLFTIMTTNASFELCTKGIVKCVYFSLLASWVNIMLVKHPVVVYRCNWLIFIALQYFIIWLCLSLFIHSTNRYVSCVLGLFWGILEECACLLVHNVCFAVGCFLQSGIAGASNKDRLNFS